MNRDSCARYRGFGVFNLGQIKFSRNDERQNEEMGELKSWAKMVSIIRYALKCDWVRREFKNSRSSLKFTEI